MKLHFDLKGVKTTEFGIGSDDGDERAFCHVAVDKNVQSALREMAQRTWNTMHDNTETPGQYEPAEKHSSTEYVYLPLADKLSTSLRELHHASNLPVTATALSEPEKVFCYFARLTDHKGQRLTALRRATQFKGVLRNRLIRLVTDALQIIEDKVFKLDTDFDLLIDSHSIHILRPSGFEFVGQLQAAVLGRGVAGGCAGALGSEALSLLVNRTLVSESYAGGKTSGMRKSRKASNPSSWCWAFSRGI